MLQERAYVGDESGCVGSIQGSMVAGHQELNRLTDHDRAAV